MTNPLLLSIIVIVAGCAATSDAATPRCQQGPIQEGKANSCRAIKWMFTFNSRAGKCEKFSYGGCYGSENLFITEEECKQACLPTGKSSGNRIPNPQKAVSGRNVCHLPADPGYCEAIIPRYFFDTKTKKCRRFTYGGCHGNGNNFETLQDCQRVCRG